jgi:hypothetical protein
VLEIQRTSWRKPHYSVRDDGGHGGEWARRRFNEAMTGDIDGEAFEFERDGRRLFTLVSRGTEVARAEAGRAGRWNISAAGSTYELQRRSPWRMTMDLRSDGNTIGSVRRARGPRTRVLCELPPELSPAVQAFIGFVAVMIWDRIASSTGTAAAAGTG